MSALPLFPIRSGNVLIREIRAEWIADSAPDVRHGEYDPEHTARSMMALYDLPRQLQENLIAVYLDTRRRIIGTECVYRGTVNHAAVSTRDVVRNALIMNATAVVILHNHPSGDPSPSAEDLTFTRKLAESLRLVDIDLADHIVTGAQRYYSMRDKGQI